MNKKGWMMLRVLINRYNPAAGDALLKFLPKEEMQLVLDQEIRSTDLSPILHQPEKLIKQMHHSWLMPLLTKFPDRLLPILGAALHPEQAAGLKISSPTLHIAQPVKTFMLNQLYYQLEADNHLPFDYLPETELSPLLKWTKSQLVMLINFLGLYDLAPEVRRIVNHQHLKNIYNCLTPKQFYYLKVCLQQKERLVVPKLGIDPSKNECEKLKQILHRRGLIRLGRALCGQHPDLVWYLSHKLDIGRGTFLMNEFKGNTVLNVTSVLKGQVLNLMNFLKSELSQL
jgi:hypothetical protein